MKKPLKKNIRILIVVLIIVAIITPIIVLVTLYLIKPRPDEKYMVEMSDGIHLATDVYLPKGEGPYPVIFYRTPYNKDTDQGPLDFMKYGVAIVTQDSRGCNSSEGEYAAFGTDGVDSFDTIQWLKTQTWFNGTYATFGGSARGITQYMQVPYLTDLSAQFIEVATPNLYSQALFQGGAPRKMLAENWLTGIGHGDYYQTIFDGILSNSNFAKTHRIEEADYSNVTWPAIHKGGWFDCFGQGIIDGFMGYQYSGGEGGKDNSYLIMGPWTHDSGNNKVGELTFPDNAKYTPYSSELTNAFLAEALLNTLEYGNRRDYPNIIYYVMGDTLETSPIWNQWATSEVWPVPFSNQKYYLQLDNSLNTSIPTGSRTYSYSFDPSNPINTLGGANLLTGNRGPYDQRAVESGRTDIISFEYPISEAFLVTGHIFADIYVTSDCIDTDFTVKLMDVYPDGSAYNLCDGVLRMRFRNGMEEAKFMDGSNSTVYNALIDLWSTSYFFAEGHILKISISSSNYPRFDVNPNSGSTIAPFTETTPYLVANNSIIVSPEYPSALILPIPSASPSYI